MQVTTLDSRRAREQWREVLDTVMMGESDVVVTRNQKPTAVIISYADYEMIAEQLNDIRAEREAAAVYKQWKAGQLETVLWSEAKRRLRGLEDVSSDTVGEGGKGSSENS
ncbi:MAG: type II toxin-antitoxin system prevent-host-death family antitoxin [Caldilineaceae bacterium]|nr:type II toxin-antitoxin system prevent-host-death family antitoxin [Caldilineaceae bacterium]